MELDPKIYYKHKQIWSLSGVDVMVRVRNPDRLCTWPALESSFNNPSRLLIRSVAHDLEC